jgi:nucleoside-diphosphate-sugar epimerase
MQRNLLDVSRLKRLGWRPQIGLAEGIRATCAWYGTAAAKPPVSRYHRF